ncbi:MAG: hypothetical protein SAK29_15670, partial [Scytonema sp. PMC 1069.18]|nr:hypothetical protein [Scytonema sp. PMC 1069.18]
MISFSKLSAPVAIMPQHDNSILHSQARDGDRYHNIEKYNLATDSETRKSNKYFPVSLGKVSQYSRTVYNTAKNKDWDDTTTNVFLLEKAVKSLGREVKDNKTEVARLNFKIELLKIAMMARNGPSVMHDINQVFLITDRMSVQFQPKIPVDVLLLEYYGRELEIWAPTGNKAWLHKTAKNMGHTWKTARPYVVASGGTAQARNFDSLVNRVEVASSASEYESLATSVLNKV